MTPRCVERLAREPLRTYSFLPEFHFLELSLLERREGSCSGVAAPLGGDRKLDFVTSDESSAWPGT